MKGISMAEIPKIHRKKIKKTETRARALSPSSAKKLCTFVKASYKAKYPKHHKDKHRKIEISTRIFQLTYLSRNFMAPKLPKCGRVCDVYLPIDLFDHPLHCPQGYHSDFELFFQ
jgi:hypothetical protein